MHILHGDIGPALALPDLMDNADVRVGQGRGRLGLDEEPLLELGRVHQVRRQELQGDRSPELDVLGPIDDPHAAVTDFVDDLVFSGDETARFHNRGGRFDSFGEGNAFAVQRER